MYCLRPQGWLAACLLLLFGAACSRSHTFIASDGKVSVQDKGKGASSLTVTDKDGKTATMSFNENKVPGDYPKDVPVYSPSKVVLSQSLSDQNGHNLMLESEDGAEKIADFYKKGLDTNGWKTESTMTTPQMTILTATKEKRQVTLQIADGGQKRSVMQVVADKK